MKRLLVCWERVNLKTHAVRGQLSYPATHCRYFSPALPSARVSFTARIEGAHSDRAALRHTNDPAELAASSPRGRPVWFPTAHVERAPFYMFLPSSLVVPPGRTIVAGPICGRRARPFLGRAHREQGTSTGALPPPLTFPSFPIAHRIHVRRPCNGCNPIRP